MSDYQKQLEGYEILKAQLRRKLLLVKKLYGMSEAENKKIKRKQKEFLEKNKKIMEGSVDYMLKTTE